MPPRISVVIPCYASPIRPSVGRLFLTLLSLERQDLPADQFEVIVVDDGSQPPLAELISTWGLNGACQVIRQPHAGMCAALMTGIAAAAGDILFLGIDDNVLSPNCLTEHLRTHEAAGQDCIAFGREHFMFSAVDGNDPVELVAKRNTPVGRDFVAERADFDVLWAQGEEISSFREIYDILNNEDYRELQAGWLVMRVGNHSMRKHLFDAIGGMETRLDPEGCYADIELGVRAWRARVPLVFCAEARAIHLSHGKSDKVIEAFTEKLAVLQEIHGMPSLGLLDDYFRKAIPGGTTIRGFSRVIAEREAEALNSAPEAGAAV